MICKTRVAACSPDDMARVLLSVSKSESPILVGAVFPRPRTPRIPRRPAYSSRKLRRAPTATELDPARQIGNKEPE
jgi:hypothetical protein